MIIALAELFEFSAVLEKLFKLKRRNYNDRHRNELRVEVPVLVTKKFEL